MPLMRCVLSPHHRDLRPPKALAAFFFHASRERHMEAEKSPFDAVRAMMLENLERVGFVTQIYVDMVERTMRLFPGANQEQIRTFKEYVQRQVATNRDFMESLLRAEDFQEAFRIQVEHLQSQLRTAAEEATQIGAWIVSLANSPMRFFG